LVPALEGGRNLIALLEKPIFPPRSTVPSSVPSAPPDRDSQEGTNCSGQWAELRAIGLLMAQLRALALVPPLHRQLGFVKKK